MSCENENLGLLTPEQLEEHLEEHKRMVEFDDYLNYLLTLSPRGMIFILTEESPGPSQDEEQIRKLEEELAKKKS